MSTKLLLSIAALVLGAPGSFLLFAPELALGGLGSRPDAAAELLAQVAGVLAIALGVNNWMARGAAIGGIYGRPLLMANLVAFFSSGLALLKAPNDLVGHPAVIIMAVLLLLCTLGFGRLLFVSPKG